MFESISSKSLVPNTLQISCDLQFFPTHKYILTVLCKIYISSFDNPSAEHLIDDGNPSACRSPFCEL